MTSILYVGMDVHTTNYTVCAYKIGNEAVFGETSFTATAENIAVYLTLCDITKRNQKR